MAIDLRQRPQTDVLSRNRREVHLHRRRYSSSPPTPHEIQINLKADYWEIQGRIFSEPFCWGNRGILSYVLPVGGV